MINWTLVAAEAIVIGMCLDKLGIMPMQQEPWLWWMMAALGAWIIFAEIIGGMLRERE